MAALRVLMEETGSIYRYALGVCCEREPINQAMGAKGKLFFFISAH